MDVHVHLGTQWRPEEASGLLDLELKVIVSHPVWGLGSEPWFPARAACTSNC